MESIEDQSNPKSDSNLTRVVNVRESISRKVSAYTRRHRVHPEGWLKDANKDEIKYVLDHVLMRSLNDERLKDIAEDIGTSKSALNRALLKHRQEDWQEVQVARALTAYQDAEEELSEADPSMVPRAREKVKSAQWQLEKLCRRLYGQDALKDIGNGVSITLNIGPLKQERVINQEGGD